IPSRDLTSEDLFSSRMMSMHSSTHSSQMKTVGPAISLRTSCWLLPQNEQYSVFLLSDVALLLIYTSLSKRGFSPSKNTRLTHLPESNLACTQSVKQILHATIMPASDSPKQA